MMAKGSGPDLSPADTTTLARLVAKYGRRAIASAVQRVRIPARAGRRREHEKHSELVAHVEWIEERADELRQKGKRHGALHQATFDRFLMVTPREKQTDGPELKRFRKRIKKLRDEWSSAGRAIKAARR